MAAQRASWEKVNDNESLIRTYHPSLSGLERVVVVAETSSGNKIWLVRDSIHYLSQLQTQSIRRLRRHIWRP
jgi:hypothetical protein